MSTTHTATEAHTLSAESKQLREAKIITWNGVGLRAEVVSVGPAPWSRALHERSSAALHT